MRNSPANSVGFSDSSQHVNSRITTGIVQVHTCEHPCLLATEIYNRVHVLIISGTFVASGLILKNEYWCLRPNSIVNWVAILMF